MMHNATLSGGKYAAFKADGTPFQTPAMISGNEAPAALCPGKGGFQVAELPYKDKDLAMVIVVPKDADGLAAVEKQLTPAGLGAWLGALAARDIDVSLPKFRIETDYRMNDPLKVLGMRLAFDAVIPSKGDGTPRTWSVRGCPRPRDAGRFPASSAVFSWGREMFGRSVNEWIHQIWGHWRITPFWWPAPPSLDLRRPHRSRSVMAASRRRNSGTASSMMAAYSAASSSGR